MIAGNSSKGGGLTSHSVRECGGAGKKGPVFPDIQLQEKERSVQRKVLGEGEFGAGSLHAAGDRGKPGSGREGRRFQKEDSRGGPVSKECTRKTDVRTKINE